MYLWSIQEEEVWQEIQEAGTYRCDPYKSELLQPMDKALIGKKLEPQFEAAYEWLAEQMEQRIKNNQNPYEVTYLNGSMPMINCSRSAIAPLKFWWIIMHTGVEGFTEQATGMLETAAWLKAELDKLNWPAWLEPMSNTVYFKRPTEEFMVKYALAPDEN